MKHIGILALVLVLLMMAACTGTQPELPTEPSAAPAIATEPPTDPVTDPLPTEPEETKPVDWTINFLTGKSDITQKEARPVAVMIPNDPLARGIQHGIETADLLMECETEGGITRLMAVWADDALLPDFIGPVRSARSPFVKIASALDTIYAHCGGSVGGMNTLSNTGLDHIDAQSYDGGLGNTKSVFWRDRDMNNATNWEHSLVTCGENLRKHIEKKEIRTTGSNHSPYVFGEVTGGESAQTAEITLSSAQTISFQYDKDSNLYLKSNGTLANAKPHKSADGNQISASNVIVMYATRFVELVTSTSIYDFELDSGVGKVLSCGTVREIKWTRNADGLTFTEADGTPLTVAEGQTYLCLIDSSRMDQTVIQ